MTEQERRRRSVHLRIGVVLALCLIGAVPVVVAMAASPDPGSSAPTAAAPATADPSATTSKPAGDGKGALRLGLGGFGGGIDLGRGGITITAINGSSISLKTDDGWTRTITVTADTKIRKGGQDATAADLAVGDKIRLAQKRNDDGTYTVTAISVPTPKTGGEVSAISGDTLTLKRRNGETQTVTLTGSTKYTFGKDAGTKADVTVGSQVTVEGTTSGTDFTALSVHVQPAVVAGEVTAKTATSLTLKQRDGTTIVVHVSADTKYGLRGGKTGGLADIAVGDKAWASGKTRSDGSLDATGVANGFGRGKGDHKDAKPGSSAAPSATAG